jgi:cysteine protease ATG4
MLIGFLIRDEDDWDTWKSSVKHVQGKAIINVSATDPATGLSVGARAEAIDEVEAMSDDDNDEDDALRFNDEDEDDDTALAV